MVRRGSVGRFEEPTEVTESGARGQSFWVYVIELDTDALSAKDQTDLGKGAVYVGYTSTTPEERLAKHKTLTRTAGRVFRRMTDAGRSRLRPDLAIYVGPWPSLEAALRNEKRMHNRLVSDGYRVFGNRGRRFMAKRTGTNSDP